MNTRVVKPDARALEEAGALIRAGQVVGFPTETVYALAPVVAPAVKCSFVSSSA